MNDNINLGNSIMKYQSPYLKRSNYDKNLNKNESLSSING